MTDPLFFSDDFTEPCPAVGSRFTLGGDDGRHAAVVRRIRLGETILIGDGRGNGDYRPAYGPVQQPRLRGGIQYRRALVRRRFGRCSSGIAPSLRSADAGTSLHEHGLGVAT